MHHSILSFLCIVSLLFVYFKPIYAFHHTSTSSNTVQRFLTYHPTALLHKTRHPTRQTTTNTRHVTLIPDQERSPYPVNTPARIRKLFEQLDDLYTESSVKIKCPFFRRRAADLIDGVAMVARFLLIRHKSIIALLSVDSNDRISNSEDFLGSILPPGCRTNVRFQKCLGLSTDEIASIVRNDWTLQTTALPVTAVLGVSHDEHSPGATKIVLHNKGYYITGKLNTTIYRDDCLFSGPDPDMPVRGLRKYLSASSKLFDHRKSYADLLDLKIIDENNAKAAGFRKIEARWRIGGVVMLPWHPIIKPYTGKTIYHLDKNGLIHHHEEHWDISVWQAFTETIFMHTGK